MKQDELRDPQRSRKSDCRSVDDGLLMSVLYEVIDYWPQAVLLVGRGGACLPNAQALRLFGVAQNEVIFGDQLIAALGLRCCNSGRTLQVEEYPSQRALQGEYLHHDFVVYERQTSAEVTLRCDAQPIRSGNQIVGALTTWTDVSDLRRSTERIRKSTHELQQFSAIASHDLQQPIRTMSCYLDLLRPHVSALPDGSALSLLEQAKQGATRMRRLLSNLLDLTRIERQEGDRRQQVDCRDVWREVCDNLAEEIREAQAEVVFPEPPVVMADRAFLVVLLQNLVGNSLKYRHPDRRCCVYVTARPSPNEALFSVHDNGVGIESAYLDVIFKPFQRLDAQPGIAGSGLGLDICRRIVSAHDGRIWAESEPGVGSTFFFTLKNGHEHAALEPRPLPPARGEQTGDRSC